MADITFTRLQYEDGKPWGAKVPSGIKVKAGDKVTIVTKSGRETEKELDRKVGETDEFKLYTLKGQNGGGNGQVDRIGELQQQMGALIAGVAELTLRVEKLEEMV